MAAPETKALTEAVRALREAGANRVTVSPDGTVAGEFAEAAPRSPSMTVEWQPWHKPAGFFSNWAVTCAEATPDRVAAHDRAYDTPEPD